MSKFFKDNKTAQSRRCLLHQIALEIMLLKKSKAAGLQGLWKPDGEVFAIS